MSFDPMAAAIDWLDAFRSGDLDFLPTLFAQGANIRCNCCSASYANKNDLRAFWEQRLRDCRPLELDDLEVSGEGVLITYKTLGNLVAATLDFDGAGRIISLECDFIAPTGGAS